MIPVVLVINTLMFAVATSGKIGALQTFGSMGKRDAFLIPLFLCRRGNRLDVLAPACFANRLDCDS